MTSMTRTTVGVTGGVDRHGHSHHAAVIDHLGRQPGDREFPHRRWVIAPRREADRAELAAQVASVHAEARAGWRPRQRHRPQARLGRSGSTTTPGSIALSWLRSSGSGLCLTRWSWWDAIRNPNDYVDGISCGAENRDIERCIRARHSVPLLDRGVKCGLRLARRLDDCRWKSDGLGKWSALSESLLGRIFISYRRQETAWPAGRLYDVLVEHFAAEQVFKDVDNIEPGEDFVERIAAAVGSCDVLLVLIGPQWLTITDEDGQRRLEILRTTSG